MSDSGESGTRHTINALEPHFFGDLSCSLLARGAKATLARHLRGFEQSGKAPA